MEEISPRWLLSFLPWVAVEAGNKTELTNIRNILNNPIGYGE